MKGSSGMIVEDPSTYSEASGRDLSHKRGLLLLIGGSFRSYYGDHRPVGEPISYEGQMTACRSHIDFIRHIESAHNNKVDVHFTTYSTPYDQDLLDIYGDHLVSHHFCDKNHMIGINGLFRRSFSGNDSERVDVSKYDYIFTARIDCFLKPHLSEIFDLHWDIMRFTSLNWLLTCSIDGYPRVNAALMFIPRRLFPVIPKIDDVAHYTWKELREHRCISADDMDFMLQTAHDANSELDQNPLYYFVNRPENDIWHDKHYIFDRSGFKQ